jgi:hypothetical protein
MMTFAGRHYVFVKMWTKPQRNYPGYALCYRPATATYHKLRADRVIIGLPY